ncbi:universal stress protein [Ligilactobacillus faecis]|uniref:universal stress protein n=1 Tax=Ligilactobacillus faecis TaxID=762833 RepID=UPI002468F9FC|nr:universal stress protein [Ligilactobacillus faecis]WGN90107.1 universal stress protein [Ligilactobacillus faecis]
MTVTYRQILVAVDGSNGANAALKTAVEVAKRNDAHLDILRVLDLNSLEYGGAGIALDGEQIYRIEQENEQYLLELRNDLIKKYDFRPEQINVHIRFGNPKLVIAEDFPEEYQSDLIIVGSTGKNILHRIVTGSVAAHVTRVANCDVLVARTTEADLK